MRPSRGGKKLHCLPVRGITGSPDMLSVTGSQSYEEIHAHLCIIMMVLCLTPPAGWPVTGWVLLPATWTLVGQRLTSTPY